MSEIILTDRANIVAIANAVRNKTGVFNNMNLGDIVDAINSIQQGQGESVNLDEEITEQETLATSQDTLVSDILSALESKVAGGNNEISMTTTTISEEETAWADSITVPELIGAKYFIIQGNPLTAVNMANTNYMDDGSILRQIIYLNGLAYVSVLERGSASIRSCHTTTQILADASALFNETTGTIAFSGGYAKVSTDPSTTGVVYTVYRLG